MANRTLDRCINEGFILFRCKLGEILQYFGKILKGRRLQAVSKEGYKYVF